MITKLARTNLYLLRSNGSYKSNGLNFVRCLADKSSADKGTVDKSSSNRSQAPKAKKAADQPAKSPAEILGKPQKPSDQYQSPEYFGYNEYSYNDLIFDMEKHRNPQPAPK